MKYFLQRNRRTGWFLLALAVSFVLISGALAGRADTRGLGFAERLLVWAVSPLQQGLGTLRGLAQIAWYDYLNLVGLREKNVLLEARVTILERELHRAREEAAATGRLAKLLFFKMNSDVDLLTARVIGRDGTGWAGTVTIDRGTDDGLQPNMAVVGGRGGVVGRIVRLHPAYAQVLLLTDYNSAVDALVQRTRDKGVLAGQGLGCELKYVERQADVQQGDTIVTSGVGGIFPPGLLLGTVRTVNREGPGLFQSVAVAPAVRPDRLEEVQVVLGGAAVTVVLWAAFAVVLTALQTTVAGWLGAGPVTPDFIMTACILLAVYTDRDDLHVVAPALGFLRDLYSGGVPGQSVLVLAAVVWLIRRDKHRLDFDSYLLDVTVVLATLLDGLTAWSLRRLISPWELSAGWLALNLVGRSLAGMLLIELLRLAWREWIEPWREGRRAEARRSAELLGRQGG